LLWFDNVGNEAAFNIEFDDLLIGKAVVFIGRIDSLVKDGGSDKPLLRGTLGEKPYGLSPPTSEQVLEIALYSEYTKLIAGLVNTESELAPIDDSGTVFKLGNTEHYEWPLTVHYEDSTGLCYTSQYSVRLSIPLAEIAFLHKAPLARSRSKARL
jgi:hypothetical protein